MIIQNIVKMIGVGIWNYEMETGKLDCSDEVFDIYGIEKTENVNYEVFTSRVHPDDHTSFVVAYRSAVENGIGFRTAFHIVRDDGSIRLLDQYTDLVFDEDQKILRVIGTTFDITEQQKSQQNPDGKQGNLKEIARFLEVGIWTVDTATNKVLFCSKGMEPICGYSSSVFEMNIMSWGDIVFHEDFQDYRDRQEMLKREKLPQSEYRIVHKNGEIRWVRDESIPTYDEAGKLIRLDGIITDITEQKSTQSQLDYLARLAYHDDLTELPNRRMFNEEVNALLEKSALFDSKFAVLYLDMDGFKKVNDTLGHHTGDELLKEFSLRLKLCISSHDFVARLGGDEFSVLIRNMKGREQIEEIASKMIDLLGEPYLIGESELFVTVSIGIAVFPIDGESAETLLERADLSLYRIKEKGKNNYKFYNQSMTEDAYKSYSLERDLRKAVDRNEFEMYYQAKINAKTNGLVGAEALIRWNHPNGNRIFPGDFIPLAEENGMIFAITIWTFRAACEQLKRWEKGGLTTVPISVNISPEIFDRQDWVETLLQIMDETNVDPGLLELEITEGVLIQNDETFITSIETLKQSGIKISIDDFGTGYSSLLYLKKFKVDTIKIDQSFTRELLNNDVSLILKAIIRLAHELDMTVIAEGVETAEQATYLRQNECDQIQGYLISKPIPVGEFVQLLENPVIQIAKGKSRQPAQNRRKGFRVEMIFPLGSTMTVIQYKEKSVRVGAIEVLVENIGLGGLRFMSHVALPVDDDILLEFGTTILDEALKLTGHIVWKENIGEFHQYGVQFKLSENEQPALVKLLNSFAIQVRKNPYLPNCNFVKVEKMRYLKAIRNGVEV
ncbi:EAL domain-containing protein [Filibacter tadaridae]|uniref:EAL domain-containing protein n=1 Tax=Filibacter tadaridae TaxID=2483811 RepID=UPI0039E9AB65